MLSIFANGLTFSFFKPIHFSRIYVILEHKRPSWGAGGGGGSGSPKMEKLAFLGKTIDAVWAKINHTNFICT